MEKFGEQKKVPRAWKSSIRIENFHEYRKVSWAWKGSRNMEIFYKHGRGLFKLKST